MKPEKVREIYLRYPKTVAEVEEYLSRNLKIGTDGIDSLEKLVADVKKNVTSSTQVFMTVGDRFLYEFFDSLGIYPHTYPHGDGFGGRTPHFQWKVGNIIGLASDRREAEEAAFVEAFKQREEYHDTDRSNSAIQT